MKVSDTKPKNIPVLTSGEIYYSESEEYLLDRKEDVIHFIPISNKKIANEYIKFHQKPKIRIPPIVKNWFQKITEAEFEQVYKTQPFLNKRTFLCIGCYLEVISKIPSSGAIKKLKNHTNQKEIIYQRNMDLELKVNLLFIRK